MHLAEQVGETPRFQPIERGPFLGGHVGAALSLGSVPHIYVGGRNVEIATDGDGLVGFAVLLEVYAEPFQPGELVGVVVVVEGASVGYVHRGAAHSAAGGGQHASVAVGLAAVRKVGDHVVDADAGQNSDTVPLSLAVMSGLITERLEG